MRATPLALSCLLLACGARSGPPVTSRAAPAATPVAPPRVAPEGGWTTTVQADHPAVGTLLRMADGAELDEAALVEEARRHRFVLLGEKHDNPDHHRLQARLLRRLGAPDAPVVFEMLDGDDVDALPALGGAPEPQDLAEAVDWEASGWPDFAIYEPVFAAVHGLGARAVPGVPARATLKGVMMEGLETLSAADAEELRLDRSAGPLVLDAHAEDIRLSHCGHAPESIVPAMVLGQRLKDAWLARALRQSAVPPQAAGPVPSPAGFLVAGGGHARPDRGVPLYLEDAFTIAFVEVPRGGGALDVADYAGAADVLWFTPRVDDEDPCAAFEEQLKTLGPAE